MGLGVEGVEGGVGGVGGDLRTYTARPMKGKTVI